MEYILDKEEESQILLVSTERKMRIVDFFAMILGKAGTGLALYEYDLFYDFAYQYVSNGKLLPGANDDMKHEPDENFYLRIFISCLTGLLCLLVYYRYTLYLKIENLKGEYDNLDTLITSGLYIPMLCEIIFCAIHVPPRVNYGIQLSQYEGSFVYTINMLLSLAMLGRVYLM